MASNFLASRIGTAPPLENQIPERSYVALATCMIHNCCSEPTFFMVQTSKIRIKSLPFPQRSFQSTRRQWRIAFALDTGGVPDEGGQEGINGNNSNLNATRLGRIVTAGGRQLLEKLNLARRNFPMKIFLLLLDGDWDVLVAGIVVAAIEGIGMLMYRKPPSQSSGRLKSFVMMVNYWKAGVCLGLFVDAFKLGS
ncbi:ycf20-like protein [Pyrus ussuriensis x Pyrus communis]|uniref:Ycf20-like protein n=1 Tax=Pyrus ussuriensis x Pyrus communis TaxID=2448454 RepID=A0A5N5I336_9ROSA|nr:ycf20-like protein [Pyrus ussuriensis x Pyrus communis]